MDIIATIATIILVLCPSQQTLRSIREGHSDGLAGIGLLMWLSGCILMTIYLLSIPTSSIYVIINFVVSIVMASIQTYFKFFPRRRVDKS